MKANELRKGNLICQVIGGNIHTVEGYFRDEIFLSDGLKSNIKDQWIGIPLTEEWLVRFGFYKMTNGDFAFNKDGQYDEDDFKFAVSDERSIYNGSPEFGCFYWNGMSQLPDINIVFVHQLQNLYFVLTGEELKLTNK